MGVTLRLTLARFYDAADSRARRNSYCPTRDACNDRNRYPPRRRSMTRSVCSRRQFAMLLAPGTAPRTARNAAGSRASAGRSRSPAAPTRAWARDVRQPRVGALPAGEALYKIPAPLTTTGRAPRRSLRGRGRASSAPSHHRQRPSGGILRGHRTTVLEPLWSEVTANPERVHVIVVRVSATPTGPPPDYRRPSLQLRRRGRTAKPAHRSGLHPAHRPTDSHRRSQNSRTDNTVLRS